MNIVHENRQSGGLIRQSHTSQKMPKGPLSFHFNTETHPALVGYAVPLITLAVTLKNSTHIDNFVKLRQLAADMLSCYRQSLMGLAIESHDIDLAHYILCATIDDAILNQSWHARVGWAEYSLTAYFHHDVNSGDRFFELLDNALGMQPPDKPLLLLFYYCLTMSFRGRLQLPDQQTQEKKRILNQLYRILAADFGSQLPVIGIGAERLPLRKRIKPLRFLPVLLLVIISVNLISGAAYAVLSSPIKQGASQQLLALMRYQPTTSLPADRLKTTQSAPAPIVKPSPKLDELLSAEVKSNDIVLLKSADGTPFIRILRGPLFASASDKIAPDAILLIQRIAAAIALTDSDVFVAGYADSQPFRSGLFASNQTLSQARANTIAQLIQPAIPDKLVRAEGKGAADPIASNKTLKGRALNRRIEIYLNRPQNNDN